MAKRQITLVYDDLDGTQIDGSRPVRFGIDGKQYEIDLSRENATLLGHVLAPYVKAARQVPRNRVR